jgi:hypothetical protein
MNAGQIAAVKNRSLKAELAPRPRNRREARAQVISYYTNKRAPDLALILPVLLRAGIGVIRKSQIRAENVYTRLLTIPPVVSQPSKSVYPSQTRRRRPRPQPVGSGGEPVIKCARALFGNSPVQLLALLLELLADDHVRILANAADTERLHAHAAQQGQETDSSSDPSRSHCGVRSRRLLVYGEQHDIES